MRQLNFLPDLLRQKGGKQRDNVEIITRLADDYFGAWVAKETSMLERHHASREAMLAPELFLSDQEVGA